MQAKGFRKTPSANRGGELPILSRNQLRVMTVTSRAPPFTRTAVWSATEADRHLKRPRMFFVATLRFRHWAITSQNQATLRTSLSAGYCPRGCQMHKKSPAQKMENGLGARVTAVPALSTLIYCLWTDSEWILSKRTDSKVIQSKLNYLRDNLTKTTSTEIQSSNSRTKRKKKKINHRDLQINRQKN